MLKSRGLLFEVAHIACESYHFYAILIVCQMMYYIVGRVVSGGNRCINIILQYHQGAAVKRIIYHGIFFAHYKCPQK